MRAVITIALMLACVCSVLGQGHGGPTDTAMLRLMYESTAEAIPFVRLEFTDDYTDSSGHNYDATSVNTSISDGAVYFDGNGDYLYFSDEDDFDVGLRDWSWSVWVKLAGQQPELWSGARLASICGSVLASAVRGVGISLSNERPRCRITTASGTVSLTGDDSINDSAWHHVAATFDRDGDMVLYVDGSEVDSVDISAYKMEDLQDTYNIAVGARHEASYQWMFYGYMDDFRGYDTALTASDVTILFSGGRNP